MAAVAGVSLSKTDVVTSGQLWLTACSSCKEPTAWCTRSGTNVIQCFLAENSGVSDHDVTWLVFFFNKTQKVLQPIKLWTEHCSAHTFSLPSPLLTIIELQRQSVSVPFSQFACQRICQSATVGNGTLEQHHGSADTSEVSSPHGQNSPADPGLSSQSHDPKMRSEFVTFWCLKVR